MAAGGNLSSLQEDLLCCPICTNEFEKDKMLPCGHTFCLICLSKYVKSRSTRAGSMFPCPTCRGETQLPKHGVDGFPGNFLMKSLQDSLPHILDAASAMENMPRSSKKKKKRKNKQGQQGGATSSRQELFSEPEIEEKKPIENACKLHPELPVTLYCKNCCVLICVKCERDHGYHVIESVKSAWRDISGKLNDFKEKYTERITAHEINLGNLDFAVQELNKNEEEIISEIDSRAETLCRSIRATADDKKRNFKALSSKLSKSYQHAITVMKKDVSGMKEKKEETEKLESITNDVEKLSQASNLLGDCQAFSHTRSNPTAVLKCFHFFSEYDFPDTYAAAEKIFGTFTSTEMTSKEVKEIDVSHLQVSGIAVTEDDNILVCSKKSTFSSFFFKTISGFEMLSPCGSKLSGVTIDQSSSPYAICGHKNNIYVYDSMQGNVLLYSKWGGMVSTIRMNLKGEGGICVNENGEIFASSPNDKIIRKHSRGRTSTFINQFQYPHMECPKALAVNKNNHLFVVDSKKGTVFAFDEHGTRLFSYNPQLPPEKIALQGICLDRYGHILVADSIRGKITILTSEGKLIGHIQNSRPWAIAVNNSGELLVIDGLVRSSSIHVKKYFLGY